MQIPMEILSLMTPRADAGAAIRQNAPAAKKADSAFDQILDESHAAITYEKTAETGKAGGTPDREDTEPAIQKKPDKDPVEGDILAAGAMGYQNVIVFFIEVDEESADAPDVDADTIRITDTIAMDNGAASAEIIEDAEPEPTYSGKEAEPPVFTGAETKAEPDAIAAADTKTIPGAEMIPDAVTAADVKIAVDENTAEDTTAAVYPEDAPIAYPVDAEIPIDRAAGEATVHKPVIRMSEKRENDDDADIADRGDLKPIENENEKIPMKGQKEKAGSDAEDTAGNKAEGAQEQLINYPIPLTESISPERFQADQQMKQVADTPVRAENLFDEMVSRIETMHTGNQQAVTIQLKPEILGKVALEIAMDATGLHIKINAADSDVRTMINGQINALIESLETKGIEVVDVEVAYTGVDNGDFQEPHKDQAQPERQRRSYRIDGIDDNAAYYAALPFETLEYYLDAGVSSVEYRA